MYLTHKDKKYPCDSRPGATMVYLGLPEDFPVPVDGEITLCADNGFVLRTDNAADYQRQTFEGGVLVLTNEPEPELPPDPPVEALPTEAQLLGQEITNMQLEQIEQGQFATDLQLEIMEGKANV